MKRILLAATFLTAATALSLPANAIDINVGAGAEGTLDIIVGGNGGNAGAGVNAGANVGVNAGANAAGAAGAAGNAAGAAGNAAGNAAATANGTATTGINATAAAVTEVMLRTNATADATTAFAADAVVNATVWTNDNVNFGTVVSLMTTVDGEVVAIVDTTDGWMQNVDRVAIRASTLVRTDAGLVVQTDDADLKASIAAGLAAQAAAATR